MKRTAYILWLGLVAGTAAAQERWSVDRCMRYAATHSHAVRQQEATLDDSRADRVEAVGAFLPGVEGSVGAQYNFGRAIDPETNAYTNVSTFYNSYGLSASIPVFDGFRRIHELRRAKAAVLMGTHALRASRDDAAMRVYKAFTDVCYYRETVTMASRKRDESTALLRQTRVMAEVGTKGEADVAQMEATCAADDYEVTRQESLLANALLALKAEMNYPADSTLLLDTALVEPSAAALPTAAEVYAASVGLNPKVCEAEMGVQVARQSLSAARGALLPTLSIGGGISTTYYKTLHSTTAASFGSQFRNNAGEYVFASLSIPLFNRLATVTAIRRQRNNLRRALDRLDEQRSELRRLVTEATTDCANSRAEQVKMARKVEADSIAAHLAVRKYEEGLASPIDVQTTAVALLQSRVALLQSRLTLAYKLRLLNYYQGQPLWTDQ